MDKLLLLLLLFLAITPSRTHGGAAITSCAQTPYPEVCDHYITTTTTASAAATANGYGHEFRDVALRVTMNQAVEAYRLVSSAASLFTEPKAKLAWEDCMELYDDAVYQLNRSVSSTNQLDAQTWLSAAIANHETCKNGFVENDLSFQLQFLPNMLSNFSKLLSNSLAINKATAQPSSSSSSGGGRRLLSGDFPVWLSSADRRLLAGSPGGATIEVAGDGSGQYKTISEAVAAAAGKGGESVVIHVKAGVYRENVEIKRSMKNLMIIGDGIDATVVTGDKSAEDTTTFRSATFAVSGDGFMARDITFENTAGPQKHQAVALRSGADKSVFYRCSFKGYQDTLYVYSQRQFYRDCDIFGTVDFIFGDAAAVFQNCDIYARKPMSGQINTVTAQGRSDPNENTGIIIHNCHVTSSGDLGSTRTYLGRPWKQYSRTVVMKSTLDRVIDPAGWYPWSGSFALNTLYYGEYMNYGAGAATGGRVNWPGFHVMSAPEAVKFTVETFLAGGSWIPAFGVPFIGGL